MPLPIMLVKVPSHRVGRTRLCTQPNMQRQDHSSTLKFGVARKKSLPRTQFKNKNLCEKQQNSKSYRIIFFDKTEVTLKRLSNVDFNETKPHKILRYCPRDFKCQMIIPIITRLL